MMDVVQGDGGGARCWRWWRKVMDVVQGDGGGAR